MKIALLLGSTLLLLTSCTKLFESKDNYLSNNAWASSQQARIVLAGVVVDSDGKPLDDVQVTRRYVWLRPTVQDLPRAMTMHEERSEEVDGHFHFVFSYAKHVELQFHKKGYQDATLQFDVEPAPGGDDSLDRYLKAISLRREDLRVVMKPITPGA